MTTHDDVSFLPEDFGRRKIRRRNFAVGAAGVVCVAAATAVWAVRESNALHAAQQRHADVQRVFDQTTAALNAQRRSHDEQRQIVHRAAQIATLIDTVPRSSILAELANRLPSGASLIEVSLDSHPKPEAVLVSGSAFDTKKAAVESRRKAESAAGSPAAEMEVSLRICGLADTDVDVAHYLSELNRSPIFREVSLLISEAYRSPGKAGKTYRRFQMQMTLNADAHLPPRPQAPAPPVTADVDD